MKIIKIPAIVSTNTYASEFIGLSVGIFDHGGMLVSARQSALNFRHRKSAPGYASI